MPDLLIYCTTCRKKVPCSNPDKGFGSDGRNVLRALGACGHKVSQMLPGRSNIPRGAKAQLAISENAIDRIATLIAAGMSIESAARANDVSPGALSRYTRKNKLTRDAILLATEKRLASWLYKIEAGEKGWPSVAWLLERKHGYVRPVQQVNVQGDAAALPTSKLRELAAPKRADDAKARGIVKGESEVVSSTKSESLPKAMEAVDVEGVASEEG